MGFWIRWWYDILLSWLVCYLCRPNWILFRGDTFGCWYLWDFDFWRWVKKDKWLVVTPLMHGINIFKKTRTNWYVIYSNRLLCVKSISMKLHDTFYVKTFVIISFFTLILWFIVIHSDFYVIHLHRGRLW